MVSITDLQKYNLLYLASPYSKYPTGIDQAFKDISKIAAAFIRAKVKIYCPIAHTHPIAIHGDLDPFDHEVWMAVDEPLLKICDGLVIVMLPGWQKSDGINIELNHALQTNKPIFYYDHKTGEIDER
jgi:Domain of unknown function (DUF1937)